MKHSPLTTLLAASALVTCSSGQSVESFGDLPTEQIAADANDEARTEQNAELITKPSRYVGIDQDTYINTLTSTFTIRGRDRDPFGRHQDPNYKPPAPRIKKSKNLAAKPVKITPFSDIVEAIPITTIIPAKEQFLIGGRSFSVGSRLKLNVGKPELLTIYVKEVTTNRVTFRHGITNETAEHRLRVLPPGIVPGGDRSQPDGVIPANVDAPIPIPTPGAKRSILSSRR